MYNSQIVTDRIKNIAKSKGITMECLNATCDLSKNAISTAGKSAEGMKAKNLYVIADCLQVSVDYLLGRTDSPAVNKENNIRTGDIMSGDNSHFSGNNVTVGSKGGGEDAQELLDMIKRLSIVQRAEIILKIDEMINEK